MPFCCLSLSLATVFPFLKPQATPLSEQLLSICALSGYFSSLDGQSLGSISATFPLVVRTVCTQKVLWPMGAARACGLLGGGWRWGQATVLPCSLKPHRVVGLAVNFLWAMRNSQHFHTKEESILVIKPGSHIHLFLSFMVQIHRAGVAGCILFMLKQRLKTKETNLQFLSILLLLCVSVFGEL